MLGNPVAGLPAEEEDAVVVVLAGRDSV